MKNINTELKLLPLAFPLFLELLLGTLLGNVDTLMLSRFSDKGVASLSGMNQILSFQIIFFGFITIGTGILISQYIGAQNKKNIRKVIEVSYVMTGVIGIIMSLLYINGADKILLWVKLPKELILIGKNYFKIVGGIALAQSIFSVNSSILRTYGFTKEMLFINIFANILNVLGNGMFLFGWLNAPILGVTGVGIATSFSRVLATLATTYLVYLKIGFNFRFNHLKKFPVEIFKKLVKIGVPSATESVAWNTAQVIILTFVNEMGVISLATRSYVSIINMFSILFSASIGQSNALLIGRFIGAGKREAAKEECLKNLKIALKATSLVSITIFILRTAILSFFTKDPKIIALGGTLLFISIIIEIGRTSNLVVINSLKAAGDVNYPVIIGIFSMLGIAVPLSYFLGVSLGLGLTGVWIANGCDECLRGILVYRRWKLEKWTRGILIK